MGLYADHILPRGIAFAMGSEHCRELRPTCVGEARGRVLELGFGAGHNVAHYTDAVTELIALEPSSVARKLAHARVSAAGFPVTFAGLDGASVPLDDASVDTVVSTWTLCTIPDRGGALSEVVRVLKPGGRFLFLEHGLSADPKLARWQRRLNRIQMCFAGGCRLDVDIGAVVEESALRVERIEEFHMRGGPKVATYMYRGAATRDGG
ncbi:MAG: class I SAM-dependent methyltransferase [bacterium]|nr:class I SAM-dependent methyltransferase [bacterium]